MSLFHSGALVLTDTPHRQDKYTSLVSLLADNATGKPDSDPAPADQTGKAISLQVSPPPMLRDSTLTALQTGVVFDAPGIGKSFGDIITDVRTSSPYRAGEAVIATFIG